jgi:hypothetical protein
LAARGTRAATGDAGDRVPSKRNTKFVCVDDGRISQEWARSVCTMAFSAALAMTDAVSLRRSSASV